MTISGFEIAGGSIPGRDHLGRNEVLLGRNNQDAFLWESTEQAIFAVVCDGSSDSPHSEVGAKLGARLLVSSLEDNAAHFLREQTVRWEAYLERVRLDTLARLRVLALSAHSEDFSQVVMDYFLFTVTGFIATGQGVLVFSLGDGLYAVNGSVQVLSPFTGNFPAYLAYGLLEGWQGVEGLHFKVQRFMPSQEFESVLIASDGAVELQAVSQVNLPGRNETAGPLSQFWEKNCFFQNPDAVRRRLSLMNREIRRFDSSSNCPVCETGLLRDDTTLVVLRRMRGADKEHEL
jgi:hypothetical protein